jgi:hypothetical protein
MFAMLNRKNLSMPVKILIALFNCIILLYTFIQIWNLMQRNSFIESDQVLRLPLIFPIAGYASLLLAAGLIILPIYFKDINTFYQVVTNSIFLILCRLGFYLIVFHHNHKLFYSDQYIEVQSFSGKIGWQSWDSVTSFKNEKFAGRLILNSQNGTYNKISHFLQGYNKFFDTVCIKCSMAAKATLNNPEKGI